MKHKTRNRMEGNKQASALSNGKWTGQNDVNRILRLARKNKYYKV